MKTYNLGTCEIPGCKKVLSNAGFARVAHMRTHVRNGEAREIRKGVGRDAYSSFIWKEQDRIDRLPYLLAHAVMDKKLTLVQAEKMKDAGKYKPEGPKCEGCEEQKPLDVDGLCKQCRKMFNESTK
jgi:hypothetical protein